MFFDDDEDIEIAENLGDEEGQADLFGESDALDIAQDDADNVEPQVPEDEDLLEKKEIRDSQNADTAFGESWSFDYEKGDFVGGGMAKTSGFDTFSEWVMLALRTQRESNLIHGEDFGVNFTPVFQGKKGASAPSFIEDEIRQALEIHNRYMDLKDFQSTVEDDVISVSFTVVTTAGEVEIAADIQAG